MHEQRAIHLTSLSQLISVEVMARQVQLEAMN